MIRDLNTADKPALETFLNRHVHSSLFLLSNLRTSGIVEGVEPYQGTYVAAFDGEGIVGVAAHYWNGNVMPQAGRDVARAGDLVKAVLRTSGRELKGVVGEGANCAAAIDALSLSRDQFQLYETEGLYALSLASMKSQPLAGAVRRATESDRATLEEWYRDYNIEALNETDSAAALNDAKRSLTQRYNDDRQYVLELNGELVAASAFNAVVSPFVQIGGVWTPLSLRGRGYARACVAGMLAIAGREGFTDAILFTGDDNAPAIKAYRAIGFDLRGTFFIGLLREPYRISDAQ
jgi:uncharacterized protein